jgi:hypothetical protein
VEVEGGEGAGEVHEAGNRDRDRDGDGKEGKAKGKGRKEEARGKGKKKARDEASHDSHAATPQRGRRAAGEQDARDTNDLQMKQTKEMNLPSPFLVGQEREAKGPSPKELRRSKGKKGSKIGISGDTDGQGPDETITGQGEALQPINGEQQQGGGTRRKRAGSWKEAFLGRGPLSNWSQFRNNLLRTKDRESSGHSTPLSSPRKEVSPPMGETDGRFSQDADELRPSLERSYSEFLIKRLQAKKKKKKRRKQRKAKSKVKGMHTSDGTEHHEPLGSYIDHCVSTDTEMRNPRRSLSESNLRGLFSKEEKKRRRKRKLRRSRSIDLLWLYKNKSANRTERYGPAPASTINRYYGAGRRCTYLTFDQRSLLLALLPYISKRKRLTNATMPKTRKACGHTSHEKPYRQS